MSKSAQFILHCNNKRKKKSAPISKCLIFTLIKSAWGNNLQYRPWTALYLDSAAIETF